MALRTLIARIKRQGDPASRLLYRAAKVLTRAEIPAPRVVYKQLYTARELSNLVTDGLVQRLYYQPMFRARCERCGPGLLLQVGIPYIYGDLRLRIGENCKINGRTAFVAGSVFEAPELTLGDETNVSFGTVISVCKRVQIGSHVRIAEGCYISDNPGHPLDMERRRAHAPVDREQVKPVVIEDDVWLGTRVIVLPGVRIGRGSVIGAGSVVTKDIPPSCLAVGNPARPVRQLDPAVDGGAQARETCASAQSGTGHGNEAPALERACSDLKRDEPVGARKLGHEACDVQQHARPDVRH